MKISTLLRCGFKNCISSETILKMKLTTFFLILAFLQVQAAGFTQQINLKQQNAQLEDVFKQIMKQTDSHFVYSPQMMRDAKPVNVELINATLTEALDKCFSGQPLTYVIDNNTVVVKPKEVPPPITGKVTTSDGVTLPGVNVLIKGTTKGTATDANGNFSIDAKKGDILVFSFIGYTKQEIVIRSLTTINVVMEKGESVLNEVVVVGYGTTAKKDLTGTVSSIKSTDIQEIKSQSIDQTMVGKMAGVYVQNISGQPGAGALVYVRGLSQIRGDNQPLYVVDGVPIIINPVSGALGGLIDYGVKENPLLGINPDDVERIDVLKDASAAAIYGSRGANGVVIVSTKRGRRNQAPQFSFNISKTIQNPVKKYDYLSGPEYVDYMKYKAQEVLNSTTVPESDWIFYYPQELDILHNPDHFGSANTDWQDMIINKNAMWNQYSFNVNGGSEKVNYLVSLGVSDQDGVMIENKFKRYTFSSNLDANITNWFKVGTSISYNHSINNSKGFSSLYLGSFRPDLPAYNADGSYPTYVGNYGEQYTLIGEGMSTRKKAISNNVFGSVYGEFEVIKGLKFKSQVSIGLNEDKTNVFRTSMNSENLFYGLYYARPGATLGVQTNNSWSTSFVNTLNYNKTFNEDHKIDAVAGISWDQSRYDANSQTYRKFPDDDVLTDINSASIFDLAESESLEQGLNSIFGRVNYIYKDKYLATFTARRDGSTKFGPDNRYGFFPSGALAWNMHKEEFMKNIDFVDLLKVRLSMGRVGSDNLPSFTYLAYYKPAENDGSLYNGINGIVVTGVPNSKIRWESTDQLDIGLEFGLFNNRLTGEITYFKKMTSGIILFEPVPYETGSLSWNTNVGDVSNKGWEFLIGGDVFRGNDFTWNSSFNISFIKNKVESLYKANVGYQSGIIEGYPIGVITGYDVIKIAQTPEEINALNAAAPGGTYQSSLTQPGDYIFRDINGDGVITAAGDRGPIGDINPDYFGGWNNHMRYKNWNFSMNWNFAVGGSRAYDAITNLYYVDYASNVSSLVKDCWTPEHTNALYARHGSPTIGYRATSRSIVDASYLKLRSLSISYNLPKAWFGKTGFTNAKLTLSGNNLITITKYPGLDPEDIRSYTRGGITTDFISDDGMSYPNIRTTSVSLNVTF